MSLKEDSGSERKKEDKRIKAEIREERKYDAAGSECRGREQEPMNVASEIKMVKSKETDSLLQNTEGISPSDTLMLAQ